jgi:hypothetical protein
MRLIVRLLNSLFGRNDKKAVAPARPIRQPRPASNRRRGVLIQGVEWQGDQLALSFFRLNKLEEVFVDQDRSSVIAVMRATEFDLWELERLLIGKRVDLSFHDGRVAVHESSPAKTPSANQVAAFASRMNKVVAGRIDSATVQRRYAEDNETLVYSLAVIIDQQMYWVNIEKSELPVLAGVNFDSKDDRYMLDRVLATKHIIGFVTRAKADEHGHRTITLHRWSDADACRELNSTKRCAATR